MNQDFASLGLAKPILRAIARANLSTPTAIQALSIPRILDGEDILASAQTGTGKTASFALPIINKILLNPVGNQKPGEPRALILTPTRELAVQVEQSVHTYNKDAGLRTLVMYGGTNIGQQIKALKKPIDIVVATPGRLLDHVQKRTLKLGTVETLVLDEADRMLDMGFIHDIRRVFSHLPEEHQTLLFSATFSKEIRTLAKELMTDPQEISVAPANSTTSLVTQNCVLTRQSDKRDLVSHIIRNNSWHQVLVFTRTKHGANRLAEKLAKDGLKATAIHGNKSQAARSKALEGFKKGKIAVLVATDIAARGLDIDNLPQVINFELPNVPEDYVHRIGRTGRAGRTGASLSLVDQSEVKYLHAIERLIKHNIDPIKVEGWEGEEIVFSKPKKSVKKPAKKFSKKPTDRKPTAKSSSDRKFSDRKPSDRNSSDRSSSDRNSSDRKFSDKKSPSSFKARSSKSATNGKKPQANSFQPKRQTKRPTRSVNSTYESATRS